MEFWTIIINEIRSIIRDSFSWITSLLFFCFVVFLLSMNFMLDPYTLKTVAPSIIWTTALLTTVISINQLLYNDAKEGLLEQLILSCHSLTLLVLCKVLSHWIMYSLPLIIISPILGLLLGLNGNTLFILSITLILGTPVLNLLGGLGATLLISVRGNSLLLPLIIMPFYIPVFIFGLGTLKSYQLGQTIQPCLAIMSALLLLSAAILPILSASALRNGVNQ